MQGTDLERDALARRLRAERTEWANIATLARLQRDQTVTELQNAKRELSLARGENRKLKSLLASVQDLMTSKQWASSSLGPVTGGAVGRVMRAVSECEGKAGRELPLAAVYGIEIPEREK